MKKISAFFVSFMTVIMFMGAVSFLSVSAATVLPTDSSSPKSGCVFLGIEGKYITQIQEALDRINEIRLEACKEGVKNPSSSTGSPLTIADYVPIQWSSDLEYIARLRAAEASVTIDHKRLNGESIWELKSPNGIGSFGEILAWNWSETMTQGINQWYEEKNDWVNNTPGAVTGHYTQMINPNNHYVGLGTFCSKSARYYNTTAGEFNSYDLNDNNTDTSRGKPTGNIIQTLEVKNEYITYNISGSDDLSVSAAVTFEDDWFGTLKTENLTLVGDSAKNVQWSSSNNNVVTVSNGKLTVKKCGSAVITAKLPDGSTLTKSVSYQHSYKTTTTAATCKSDGKIVKTCTVCGDTNTQVIPKTNQHSYKTTTTAATCKSDGKIVKTCTVCGDTNTQVIPKTNQHSYKTTTTAATCASDGKIVKTCTVCGDTNTQVIPKTNQHSYKTTTTAATCKTDGKTVKTCTVCGDTNTQVIPKTNQHSYKTTTTAATCASDGKTVKTCTVCGDTNTQVIPKTNQHSFGNWVTTKAPTENSDGLEKRTCSVCSTEETRTLRYEPDTSSDTNSSSNDNSSTSSSDENSSDNSSDNTSSSTSSDENSSATSSDDNSSENSSDNSSSATSPDDSSSANSSDDISSTTSSDNSSSAPSSSNNSSDISSDNETQSEDISGSSNGTDTSVTSDNSLSTGMLLSGMGMFAIIGGVLLAGIIVLLIVLTKRKRK